MQTYKKSLAKRNRQAKKLHLNPANVQPGSLINKLNKQPRKRTVAMLGLI